jgi:hypothetical protein
MFMRESDKHTRLYGAKCAVFCSGKAIHILGFRGSTYSIFIRESDKNTRL